MTIRELLQGDTTDPQITIGLMDWLVRAGGFPPSGHRTLRLGWLHHKGTAVGAHTTYCKKTGDFKAGDSNDLTAQRFKIAAKRTQTALARGHLSNEVRLQTILSARQELPPGDSWKTAHPGELGLGGGSERTGGGGDRDPNIEPPPEYQSLFSFVGYGRLDAPVWLLGLEEGANLDALPLAENIRRRAAQFEQVMDLHEAHSPELLNCSLADPSPTWRWMAKLVRGLRGLDIEDNAAANAYVAEELGRSAGETLLADLLPLPSPNASIWPLEYEDWFKTRAAYRRAVAPQRIELLRERLGAADPKLVFAYGAGHWPYYKALFAGSDLSRRHGLDDRFWTGRLRGTTVVLSPFLGCGQMSHEALASLVKFLRAEGLRLT